MKKDLTIAVVLWFLFTVIGIVWATNANIFPIAAAEEAVFLDEAFRLLIVLSMPVFMLVLTFLGYSIIRYRNKGEMVSDGPPIRGNTRLAIVWLVVTTALAVYVVFNPGLKGLKELSANPNADIVIKITGEQWHWDVSYPQYDLTYERATQIALPVDARIKFELASKDVIHSIWIPAFRLKLDAVPGRDTAFYVTPTQIGDTDSDSNIRVQCTELCGTGHARMQMDVRIMEPEEFDMWIAEAKSNTMSADMEGMDMGSGDADMNNMEGNTDMNSGSEMDMSGDSNMQSDENMDMNDNGNMDSDSNGNMDMDATPASDG